MSNIPINTRDIFIDGVQEKNIRIAICNNKKLYRFYSEYNNIVSILGNVYIAKINRIDKSLEAIFVTYSKNKSGFLPFNEIHPIYYNRQISFENKFDFIQMNDLKKTKFISNNINNIDKKTEISLDEYDKILINRQHFNTLKLGDLILVQIRKEERECKQASLTTFINITGRYLIFLPNKSDNSGISRKITASLKRKLIKNTIESFLAIVQLNNKASLIARTSSEYTTDEMLFQDYKNLCNIWNKIITNIKYQNISVKLIYSENNFLQKIVRDYLDHRIDRIYIEGDNIGTKITQYIKNMCPEFSDKIIYYNDEIPIFSYFNLEDQILLLYLPKVNLNIGGGIIINSTEALTAIDVNSGGIKTSLKNGDMIFKINMEAAKTIGEQIRLRNISGLIVIDFIEMNIEEHKKEVVSILKKELSKDGIRTHVGSITAFGLLELSRQRSGLSLSESNTNICTICNGKGLVLKEYFMCILILNYIRKEIALNKHKFSDNVRVIIEAHSNIIVYLINNFKNEISIIQNNFIVTITFQYSNRNSLEYFSIEIL